jgi:hypothetical protein
MTYPEHEMPIRRELGTALMTFVKKVAATQLGDREEDSVMRQVATEEYRQAVLKAAAQSIEVSLAWHMLGGLDRVRQGTHRLLRPSAGVLPGGSQGGAAEDSQRNLVLHSHGGGLPV